MQKSTTKPGQAEQLIRLDRMYESLRYNDYSIEGGIGEIVDNSVEAGAANIVVEIKQEKIRKEGQKRAREVITEIAVIDDGVGMDYNTLKKCLVLGESVRPARKGKLGIGRFGVGMTLGGISLARRIEVYSRVNSNEDFLYTYIDLNEIQDGNLVVIPQPELRQPEEKYATLLKNSTGTIVVLKDCDRVTSNIEGLANYLGRTYRKFIEAALKITLNGDKVYIHDPLYMSALTAFDTKEGEPELKAEPIGIATIPLEGSDGKTADVTIRMSLLPKEWRLEKGAGGSSFAKKRKIDQNEGVSILRADREVLYGRVPYITGNKGQASALDIDRWWGCEISFPPELDDYFRVRYIKRGAEPIDSLLDQIREIIRDPVNFARKTVQKDWAVQKSEEAKTLGVYRDAEDTMAKINQILPRNKKGQNLSEKDAEKKLDEIISSSSDELQNEEARKEKKNKLRTEPYSIEPVSFPSNIFFETEHILGKTIIKLNVNHPFYEKILQPLCGPFDETDEKNANNYSDIKEAILLLLFTYAKTEAMFPDDPGNNELFENVRCQWGMFLSTVINKQYENEKRERGIYSWRQTN